MVEWGIQPEYIQEGMQTLGLLSIGLGMAFRRSIREEVRQRQEGCCDACGEFVGNGNLQTHHRKPESWGGSSNRIENAVGLCGSCHAEVDREIFEQNQMYPQVHDEKNYYPQGNGL